MEARKGGDGRRSRVRTFPGKPDLALHIQRCRPKKPATKITTTTTPMM